MTTRHAALLAVAMLLAGCATTYHETGLTGGVSASQIAADTYRISARGNGYTDATTIQDYMLLKAAETTVAAGGTHFLVVSASDASRVSNGQTQGTLNTNVVGNTAYSTYTPGVSYTIVRPGEDAYIKVIKVKAGQQPPSGAFPANEIITYVGSRVVRPK